MFQAAPFFSTFLNQLTSDHPRSVSFSPGQVFRGTVVQRFPDNSALVQVGGIQLRAKLETELEVGQKAWLQVQPTAHPITLKVLTSPDGTKRSTDASLRSLLHSLGLTDNKETRSIVQALLRAGLPVTKETVELYTSLAKTYGASEQLLQAVVVAAKRNLPLSKDVVLALRAFFASSLSDSILSFLREADALLAQRQGRSDALVQLVSSLRRQLLSLPLQFPQAVGSSADRAALSTPSASHKDDAQGTGQGAGRVGGGEPQPLSEAGERQYSGSTSERTGDKSSVAQQQENGIGGRRSPASSPYSAAQRQIPVAETGDTAGRDRATSSPAGQPHSAAGMRGERADSAAATVVGKTGANAAPERLPATADRFVPAAADRSGQQGHSQSQLASGRLTPFAADHVSRNPDAVVQYPQGQMEQPSRAGQALAGSPSTAQLPSGLTAASDAKGSVFTGGEERIGPEWASRVLAAADEPTNPIRAFLHKLGLLHERQIASLRFSDTDSVAAGQRIASVKSMLLQLSQVHAAALPRPLLEAAETLLQQVTGQQLLLLPPQHQAISQLVIQLPLRSEQGEETAFIQIEARRKGSGELDPENCRLFFNLDLHRLGITMVDVNIVNRIVNLQIYNDRPWLDAAVQELKDVFFAQLQQAGYHLSGLRVQPLPKDQQARSTATGYLSTSYQGVDIRI